MNLDPGGLPAPSEEVLRQLRAIHPGLSIVRSRWALSPVSGEPVKHPKTGERVERPRYWVWIDHKGRKAPLFAVEDPQGEYLPADQRLVRRIGTDLGHVTENEAELARVLEDIETKRMQKYEIERKEKMRRFVENNKGVWRDAMENLKNGVVNRRQPASRDPVIYGWHGQPVRSTPKPNSIPLTAKEQGIDVEE